MKTYVTTLARTLKTDVAGDIEWMMTGKRYQLWTDLLDHDSRPVMTNTKLETSLMVEPGDAIYFLGGRASLVTDLDKAENIRVKASFGGAGLGVSVHTGIKLSLTSRMGGFFKGLGQKNVERNRNVQIRDNIDGKTVTVQWDNISHNMSEQEYNNIRTKTLTCICVYNLDTKGTNPPRGTFYNAWITSTLSAPEISTWFAQCRMRQIRQEQRFVLDQLDNMGLS